MNDYNNEHKKIFSQIVKPKNTKIKKTKQNNGSNNKNTEYPVIKLNSIFLNPSFTIPKIFYVCGSKSIYKSQWITFLSKYGETYDIYEQKPIQLLCFLKQSNDSDEKWHWLDGYWIPQSYVDRIKILFIYDKPRTNYPYDRKITEDYISGEFNLNYEIIALKTRYMEQNDFLDLAKYINVNTVNIKIFYKSLKTDSNINRKDNRVIDYIDPFMLIPAKRGL